MGRQDKREQRIRRNPRDVQAADLKAVIEAHGFTCRQTRDGYACAHPGGAVVTFPVVHGGREKAGTVRTTYVVTALRTIDALPDEEDAGEE